MGCFGLLLQVILEPHFSSFLAVQFEPCPLDPFLDPGVGIEVGCFEILRRFQAVTEDVVDKVAEPGVDGAFVV